MPNDIGPELFLNVPAFALVAYVVIRWFGKLEKSMDRLADAIREQNDGQSRIVRILTLLATALQASSPLRDRLVTQALTELESRKETK